jgi:four helix bundle protein
MNEYSKVRYYRDLLVWQKAIRLAQLVYKVSEHLPSSEMFGLITQMRRAAVSVPSNIAEGRGRNTTGAFIQFLSFAEGSLAELDTQLFLAIELGFLGSAESSEAFEQIVEIRKMLQTLKR